MKNQGDLITVTKNFMDYVNGLSVIIIAIIAVVGLVGAIHAGNGLYKHLQEDDARNQTTIIGYVIAIGVCSLMTISSVILAAIGLLFVGS